MTRLLRPRLSSADISPVLPPSITNVSSRSAQEAMYDLLQADPNGIRTVISTVVSWDVSADISKIQAYVAASQETLLCPHFEQIDQQSKDVFPERPSRENAFRAGDSG